MRRNTMSLGQPTEPGAASMASVARATEHVAVGAGLPNLKQAVLIASIPVGAMLAIHEIAMLLLSIRYWGNDFSQYWSGATGIAAGHSPYSWLNAERALTAQDFHYPPPLALILAPFASLLAPDAATMLWAALGVCCLILSVRLIADTTAGSPGDSRTALRAACVLLVPAATWAIGMGQLAPELLLLTLAGTRATQRARPAMASALLGLAACIKAFPLVLGGYFLVHGPRRALLGLGMVGLTGLLASWLVLGWTALEMYLTRVIPSQRGWFTWEYNMSITGVFTRWLWHPATGQPTDASALLAQAAIGVCSLVVIVTTFIAVRRCPPTGAGVPIAFSLLTVAMLLLSPINGNYNLILLALPLTMICTHHAYLARSSRLAFYLALCLISLPVEYCTLGLPSTCALLNGPVLGELLLWLVLVRLAWNQRPSPRTGEPAAARQYAATR